MGRSTNHPEIRAIVRTLDRAEQSDRLYNGGAVRTSAAMILSFGEDGERFALPKRERWQPEAVRAVVMAFALNAPDDELRWMATVARSEFEAIGAYELDYERDQRRARGAA